MMLVHRCGGLLRWSSPSCRLLGGPGRLQWSNDTPVRLLVSQDSRLHSGVTTRGKKAGSRVNRVDTMRSQELEGVGREEREDCNSLVFQYLRESVEKSGPDLGVEEWEELREQIAGFPFNKKVVNKNTVDSCLLQYIGISGNLPLATSFTSYLTSQGDLQPPHYDHLLRLYMTAEDVTSVESCLVSLCLPLLASGHGTITKHLYWGSIQVLARTSIWRTALAALQGVVGEDGGALGSEEGFYATSAITELILRALKEGDLPVMWSLMDSPMFHGDTVHLRQTPVVKIQQLQDRVYTAWITHCTGVRQGEGGEAEADSSMVRLFCHLRARGSLPSQDLQAAILHYFSSSATHTAAVTRVSGQEGSCRKCGTSLLTNEDQEDANFHLMKQYILDSVIKKNDIYTTSKPQELEHFFKLFKAKGPFDIVIDGLNMAFNTSAKSKSQKLESMQVRDVVLHFANQGLKVLLVSRKRVKMYRDYNEIASRATVLALDNVTEDDPFMLLAALQSGPHCQIVTNDLLRQHFYILYRLDPAIGQAFTDWQVSHQIHVTAYRAYNNSKTPVSSIRHTDPVVCLPPLHPLHCTYNAPYWHIPLKPAATYDGSRSTEGQPSLSLPSHWLCVGPRGGRALRAGSPPPSEGRAGSPPPCGGREGSGYIRKSRGPKEAKRKPGDDRRGGNT